MLSKLWGILVNSYTETIRQPIYGVILLATFLMLAREAERGHAEGRGGLILHRGRGVPHSNAHG